VNFVERIAAVVKGLTARVTLVGGENAFRDLPHVRDLTPHYGALGGIQTALSVGCSSWALIVACDLPLIEINLLSALWRRRAGYDVVVPIQEDNRYQPLCAFYARERCLALADALIERGERRPRALIAQTRALAVPLTSLHSVPPWALMNVNTPAEYEEAVRHLPELKR
jgi:molybdopterin-guanine dinucleotide biosynthesis protein A